MSFSELADFKLVGGTALALQVGHRRSVDMDFFCVNKFNNRQLQSFLHENLQNFILDWENKEGFVSWIDGVKVDFFMCTFLLFIL